MPWEIVLVVFVLIGIYAAIREAKGKRSAFKKEAGDLASEKPSPNELFPKNDKQD